MAETPTAQPESAAPEAERDPDLARACEIAATDGEPDGPPISIRAAHKAYSSRGRRDAHWYRMVWRSGAWQYYARERLPEDPRERCATVYGDVRPGELVAQHDRGGPIDAVYLVTSRPGNDRLRFCTLRRTRAGTLRITLPDGRVVERPDPRRR
jgi:hypothetical protein